MGETAQTLQDDCFMASVAFEAFIDYYVECRDNGVQPDAVSAATWVKNVVANHKDEN